QPEKGRVREYPATAPRTSAFLLSTFVPDARITSNPPLLPRCLPTARQRMPLVFPFDPNIERASTIPARLYNDPVYLELEEERVFAHTWQLVGRVEQVAQSGQYFTAEVGND